MTTGVKMVEGKKKKNKFISPLSLEGIILLKLPIQALCLVETTPCQSFSGNLQNIFNLENNVVHENIDSNSQMGCQK
jgi:hypothetical protein